MPIYEAVFAVPSSLSEEDRVNSVTEVEKLIAKVGGTVKFSNEIGERKMAYSVKQHDRAYYHLIKFESPATAVENIKRHFRIDDKYIRDLVTKEE